MLNTTTKETSPSLSSFQPKGILRNSRSSPALGARTPKKAKKTKKKSGFFHKVAIEWNLFCLKLRSISEEAFVTNTAVDELFEDVNSDDAFDRLARSCRGFSATEERFLEDFKKYLSLDKMYQAYQHSDAVQIDVRSSTSANSDSNSRSPTYSLQDVIRHGTDSCSTGLTLELSEDVDEDDENEIDADSAEKLRMGFHDLDMCSLREQFETFLRKNSGLNNNSTFRADPPSAHTNVGEALWEFRRCKWLQRPRGEKDTDARIARRLESQSLSYIPRESLGRIYTNLVDKGMPLKDGKCINLTDLVDIMNQGWINEEKWERAAKGLS